MDNIASYIDHTLLKPDVTDVDIKQLCAEALEYQFASVCVPPVYVSDSYRILEDSPVKVCTVVGFPFGYDHYSSKIETIKRALDMGAAECDVVINISKVKSGDWDYISDEIERITTAIHRKNKAIIKLILETAYLDDDEIVKLCNLSIKSNVDFVKTSTGYAPKGAEIKTVMRLHELCGDHVAVKASGGIRDYDAAKKMIEAGATRIGTSSGIKIVKG